MSQSPASDVPQNQARALIEVVTRNIPSARAIAERHGLTASPAAPRKLG